MSDSWDPLDCSLPGSSIHGILQARILEWVAISFSNSSPYIAFIYDFSLHPFQRRHVHGNSVIFILSISKKQKLKSVPYRKLNFKKKKKKRKLNFPFYSMFPEISIRGSLGELNSHSVSLFKTDLLPKKRNELDCKAGNR